MQKKNLNKIAKDALMKKALESAKIVSREYSLWDKVKRESEMLIKQSEENLIVQKAILELASKKIDDEKSKEM